MCSSSVSIKYKKSRAVSSLFVCIAYRCGALKHNSKGLVNELKNASLTFNDSSWRVSKLSNQRLYIIGGESPNKIVFYSHGQTGRFTVWSNGKQNSVLENFITESRLPFAQISFMYRKLPRKRDKTKQSFTLNKLTEILLEVKVRLSTSQAYWVKPRIFRSTYFSTGYNIV